MLRFSDSVDHYSENEFLNKWTSWNEIGPYGATIVPGRHGNGMRLFQTGGLGGGIRKTLDFQPTWIVGWAAKFSWTEFPPRWRIYQLDNYQFGRDALLRVFTNSDGTLNVRMVNSGIVAASTYTVVKDRWYFYEVKTELSDLSGRLVIACTVRVTDDTGLETTVITVSRNTLLSVAGMVNGEAKANEHNFFAFGGTGLDTGTILDDFYIQDGVATADPLNPNNDFLGDVEIGVVYADSDSTPLNWTPSTPGTHFSLINETAPPDGDASYVEANPAATTDLYGWQDIADMTRTLHGVALYTFARKTEAGAKSFRAVTAPVATIYEGTPSNFVGAGYYYHQTVWDLNQETGVGWTPATFNAARFGLRVMS